MRLREERDLLVKAKRNHSFYFQCDEKWKAKLLHNLVDIKPKKKWWLFFDTIYVKKCDTERLKCPFIICRDGRPGLPWTGHQVITGLTQLQTQSTLTFTPTDILESPVNLGGSRSTQRKPTLTQGEHAKVYKRKERKLEKEQRAEWHRVWGASFRLSSSLNYILFYFKQVQTQNLLAVSNSGYNTCFYVIHVKKCCTKCLEYQT